jgi:hypothetical protein
MNLISKSKFESADGVSKDATSYATPIGVIGLLGAGLGTLMAVGVGGPIIAGALIGGAMGLGTGIIGAKITQELEALFN